MICTAAGSFCEGGRFEENTLCFCARQSPCLYNYWSSAGAIATLYRMPAGLEGQGMHLFLSADHSLLLLWQVPVALESSQQCASGHNTDYLCRCWTGVLVAWNSLAPCRMAQLKVFDCMINNNWSLICDLYCAWSNQVSRCLFWVIVSVQICWNINKILRNSSKEN